MRLIGICGRSGCGKGTFSAVARSNGFLVIDCDEVYRELVSYRSRCLIELEAEFGGEIVTDNSLNRKKLAEIVFSSPERLAKLNEITHKHITNRIDEIISECEDSQVVFLDAPTLFESGIYQRCELIVGIIASDEICLPRIIERDGLTKEQAVRRLANQKNNEFLIENCDIIIYNDSSLQDFKTAVTGVLEELKY